MFELVFIKKNFNMLLYYSRWDHTIKIISGADSKLFKMYLLLLAEQLELDAFLVENFQTSQICLSKFSIATLMFFIKKEWLFLAGIRLQDSQCYENQKQISALVTIPSLAQVITKAKI